MKTWLYERLVKPQAQPPEGMLATFSPRGLLPLPTLVALVVLEALYWFAGQQWLLGALQLWLAYAGGFAALTALRTWRGVRPPALLAAATLVVGILIGATLGAALWFWSIGSANLDSAATLRELPLPILFGLLFCSATLVTDFVASERAIAARAQQNLERQRQAAARQAAEAQLRLLQAQIEPHFLLNTLGNVRSLVKRDADRARDMLDHLVDYLHVALPRMRQSTSTLGHELDLSSSYLSIMQIRMGERLAFHVDCPPELLAQPFPPMLLQTLVENAIKHGLEPSAEPGQIHVVARADQGSAEPSLRLSVADTGVGFGKADTGGTGIGLANVRERLQSLFGNSAELIITPNMPRGVVATLIVPLSFLPPAP